MVANSLPETYRAEPATARIVAPLDAMTLIYQRRSGITHIVAEPVAEILAVMGEDIVDVGLIAARLAAKFDLGDPREARLVIADRLSELEQIGLIEKVDASGA
jgi:PqqD family protein of HPr-rel-A system